MCAHVIINPVHEMEYFTANICTFVLFYRVCTNVYIVRGLKNNRASVLESDESYIRLTFIDATLFIIL